MSRIDTHYAASTWPLSDDDAMLKYLRYILTLRPFGLCTDVDGTISETAPTVDAAVLLPGIRELLTKATHTFELVATISGRAVEDQRRMIGVPGIWHVGHHGYEWEELDTTTGEKRIILYPGVEPYLTEVAEAMDEIEAELAPQVPGLWMERKGITSGIHWRLAEDWDQADALCVPVIERIAQAHGLRARGGRLAIELYPPIITNKGEGLQRLVEMHHLKSVIYFGDELSDTDAFRTIRDAREQGKYQGIAVGVVEKPHTAEAVRQWADIVVNTPKDVMALIRYITTINRQL
jgi:trehalose 6-phosphate phosphatase